MFEAWVLVCVIGTNNCFPAQDTRGPYKTESICSDRTVEMSADILNNVPGHIPISATCIKTEGELT